MRKYLIVVDMQNDFIDGALGTAEAVGIVDTVARLVEGFDGEVIFTRDTHTEDYMNTREGKYLPVPHCIRGTHGWQITDALSTDGRVIFDKVTFGSHELAQYLAEESGAEPIESVTLVGLCTDICVISNAMLIKAKLPETDVIVKASACAGVTPESHGNALAAMRMCQIDVID